MLVPPVLLVNGGGIPFLSTSTSNDTNAASALICCPAPTSPSNPPVVQRNPHVRPLAPPEQALTAPMVEFLSAFMISSCICGTSCAVWAIQRCAYPLKESMSVLQPIRSSSSHEISTMGPS